MLILNEKLRISLRRPRLESTHCCVGAWTENSKYIVYIKLGGTEMRDDVELMVSREELIQTNSELLTEAASGGGFRV